MITTAKEFRSWDRIPVIGAFDPVLTNSQLRLWLVHVVSGNGRYGWGILLVNSHKCLIHKVIVNNRW